jgi:hypothetical protein
MIQKPTNLEHKIKSTIKVTLDQILRRLNHSPSALGDKDRVISSLPDFDSLCALEASMIISSELNLNNVENLFISLDGKRALTITEVTERICVLLEKE